MKPANREVLDHGSLPELLADRARQASDTRLVLDAGIGVIVAATLTAFRPPLWIPLSLLAVTLAAFGGWGILDRETQDAPDGSRRAIMRATRATVAVIGGISALLAGLTLFFAILGPIIS